ncbi:MAG TPA: hypothetical protein VGY76_03425 [Solirubrobacteraceae bacterium]|nr:hypothetical protein [Solirubrobacteraceae bacterium]
MSVRLQRLLAPLAVLLGALLLRLITGVGFANYDTLYALVWGQQLAGGHTPQYAIPLAPTPHPLIEALGLLLAPLGPAGVENVTVALGFLALAGCAWVVYRLGALWFGRAAGVIAAVLLLTRVRVLSDGVRAYVDLPYLLLVLSALLVACLPRRRGPRTEADNRLDPPPQTADPPRRTADPALQTDDPPSRTADPPPQTAFAGSPVAVLALLALAGLLRPEAWAFSGLYWLYLLIAQRASPRRLVGLAGIVICAPLLWIFSDFLVSGHPLWSLTNTRHTAHELARVTGIANVPQYIPRRIGEILRPPVLVAAALGGILGLLWLRSRVLLGALAGVAAVGVFALFAAAGLPINTRYAFLAAALLCVFAGGGICGWLRLPAGDPRRRWWGAVGGLLLLLLLVTVPAQYRSADRELSNLRRQQSIQDELVALVAAHTISLRCAGLVGVPNHRPIPLLALRLDASPARILSAQVQPLVRGTYVDPASGQVERAYTLDPHDPHPLTAKVPAGFARAGGNRSWLIFRRCS